ncbi:MAG: ABC transporter permease [Rhodospirillales bacterium]
MTSPAPDPSAAIQMSNAVGVWNLYSREVRRFMKVYLQTMLAPVVTTLLFLAVFALALGGGGREAAGLPFIEFLAPGLIMMAIAQNAFANTSSSLTIAKVQGNIVDTLMPPFFAGELTAAIALGGATRGVVVGFIVSLGMAVFVEMHFHSFFFIAFHAFAAALMLSLLGMIGGIWAEKFDHIAAVTNFVVTPLSFLSGTFYTIDRLPALAQTIAHFNPFFYMIDGFRYGFIGHADANPLLGLAVMTAVDAALWLICRRMFQTGYRLKA